MTGVHLPPLPGESHILARVGDRSIAVPTGGRFRIAVDPSGPLRLQPLDEPSARLLREERSAMGAPAREFDMTGLAAKLGLTVKPPALRVVPEPAPEPVRRGKAPRPATVTEMIGQEAVRVQMMTRLRSAAIRDEPAPHILFCGPPGLGKTSLAELVAVETGGTLRTTTASAVKSAPMLGRQLGRVEEGDVFFIDEIHGLDRAAEELLYTAMEDGRISVPSGSGDKKTSVEMELPPFVLVGATTRVGDLTAPLLHRFGFVGVVEYYSDDDLTQIITRAAGRQGTSITEDAAAELGRRSRGTPRIALNLLGQTWDYAVTMADSADAEVTEETVAACLALYGVDAIGLTLDDQAVLRALCEDHEGGPVGLGSLAASTGLAESTVTDAIEPYMIRVKLMQRTTSGRVATRKAFEHLGLKVPVSAAWMK